MSEAEAIRVLLAACLAAVMVWAIQVRLEWGFSISSAVDTFNPTFPISALQGVS